VVRGFLHYNSHVIARCVTGYRHDWWNTAYLLGRCIPPRKLEIKSLLGEETRERPGYCVIVLFPQSSAAVFILDSHTLGEIQVNLNAVSLEIKHRSRSDDARAGHAIVGYE